MYAGELIREAWEFRGGGVASEVWQADWAKFRERLIQARDVLEKNKTVASRDPHWYARRITVAMGLGEPKRAVLAIAREGLAKEPGYAPTYYRMQDYLDPKWGGSDQWLRYWMQESVKSLTPVEGESAYARLLWIAIITEFRRPEKIPADLDWKRLDASMDDLIHRYPTIQNHQTTLSAACASRNPELVNKRWKAYAEAMGPQIEKTIDPATYCRWPVAAASRTPDAIHPDALRGPRQPVPIGSR